MHVFFYSGAAFEQDDGFKMVKSMFLTFFRGRVVKKIALAAVDLVCVCTAIPPEEIGKDTGEKLTLEFQLRFFFYYYYFYSLSGQNVVFGCICDMNLLSYFRFGGSPLSYSCDLFLESRWRPTFPSALTISLSVFLSTYS